MIRSLSIMLLSLLAVTFLSLAPTTRIPIINHAYGHFIGGETKTIGNYKVLFLISPPKPIVGDSSTKINFSILDKDQNKDIKSIFAALTIREKDSGKIVYKTPFRLYQFGDITFPYTFQNNTNYQLELQTKISGDPKYENKPLVANFDISPLGPIFPAGIDQFIIPSITAVGVILVIVFTVRRRHIHHQK
jgi:hypothetical protein